MKAEEGGGTVAKGMYHLFLGNTTATFFLAITSIFVGRLLGPDLYGLYVIAIIPASYLIVVAGLGLPSAATRFAAKYQGEGKAGEAASFLYSITAFQGMVAVILAAATVPLSLAIANFLSRPELAPLIPLIAICFLGESLYNVATSGFQGLGRMDRSAFLQVLNAIVKLSASISLVLAGFAVTGALVGFTLSYIVAGLIGALALVAFSHRPMLSRFASDVGVALRYSLPLYAGSLISGFLGPIQGTLLAHFTTNTNIGGYGAAANISTVIALFSYPIATALFPLFSRLGDDRRLLAITYRTTTKYSTLFVAPVTMLLMALCVPVSQAVYGTAYTFSAIYLLLSIAPNLLVGFGSFSQGPLLLALGRTRKVFWAVILGAVASLGLSIALVMPFGVIGILMAGAVGGATTLVVAWTFISRELGANARVSDVTRIYVSSAVTAVVTFFVSYLPLHPILVTILGGAVYLLLFIPTLAATRALTNDDLVSLETYFGKTGPFALLLRFGIRYYRLVDGGQAPV